MAMSTEDKIALGLQTGTMALDLALQIAQIMAINNAGGVVPQAQIDALNAGIRAAQKAWDDGETSTGEGS